MGLWSRVMGGDRGDRHDEDARDVPAGPDPAAPAGASRSDPADAAAGAGQGGWNFDALAGAPFAAPPAGDVFPEFVPDPAQTERLLPRIREALKTVFDPEIPVDIYELGLVYDVQADAAGRVQVKMTLTSPACPSAQQLPGEVRYKVGAVEGVSDVRVEIVWDPPWSPEKMSEVARLHLGFF
jgi:FeS assembly SUF system protein